MTRGSAGVLPGRETGSGADPRREARSGASEHVATLEPTSIIR
jgi:hypothetical protein